MRPVLVLPLTALVLLLGACGSQAASSDPSSVGAATGVPTTTPADDDGFDLVWQEDEHEEWLRGGPMATSMPTRTCVHHEPTHEERATTDPDDSEDLSASFWMSCFDPDDYRTASACTPPPDLPADGTHVCLEGPALTQRVVDDWNRYADAEDRASAQQLGLSLEEYREQNPDLDTDGSPVVPAPRPDR